jgi:outer membrane protein OmpA-like peptidoglycan-associated protein
MKQKTLAPLILAFVAVGCAHQRHVAYANTSPEMKQVAQDTEASDVTEVGFTRGRADLTPAAKTAIRNALIDARQKGSIDNVKVVAWSDRAYPSEHEPKLSKLQRDLADARARTIKDFIARNESGFSIDTYNMAERSNAFQRMLGTSDVRVKRSLEKVNVPMQASKAVVLITRK